MGVYKYSKAIHDSFKLKTKPEPWLHAAIDVSQEGVSIAIYVWDTRQVIESSFVPFEDYGAYRHFAEMFYKRKYAKANDNGVKLNWGSNKPLSRINDELSKEPAKVATEVRGPRKKDDAKSDNKFDLSKNDNTRWIDLAQGCKLTELVEQGVLGADVKEVAEKHGKPYMPNISHVRKNAKYDLYLADVTYDQEEGTWGENVVAIAVNDVKAMLADSIKTERGMKSVDKAIATMPINDDTACGIVIRLMRAAHKQGTLNKLVGIFRAASDASRYRNFEDAFYNNLD